MDELAKIQQDFLRAQELMLHAFNQLLGYQRPRATKLQITVGAVVAKPKGLEATLPPEGM